MPTGQTIITDVLTKLNLVDPGGSPGASDSAYALAELNIMWDAWSVDEGLIYAILALQFPFTAFQQNYAIGPGAGADWSITTRPQRIYGASAVNAVSFSATTQSSKTVLVSDTTGLLVGMRLIGAGIPYNTTILSISTNTSIGISIAATASASVTLVATGQNRNPLTIVDSRHYLSHNDLGASATTPDEIYPNYLPDVNGNMEVRVWPVVNETQKSYVELEAAVPFSAWTLATNYYIPPAYQDAIEWTLAFRLLSGFGEAVDAKVAQVVIQEAQKAEARIREMNRFDRMLPPPAVQAPGTQEAIAAQAAPQRGQ